MTPGVVFNGKFLSGPARGLARVASELIGAVDSLLEERGAAARSWELACRPDTARSLPLRHIRQRPGGRIGGVLWEQLDLPSLAAGKLLINPCNMSPLAVRGAISFIHDAHVFQMPESHSLGYAAWYRFALPRVARAASRVVTVSNYSRDRLVEFGVAPADKIVVIHNGGEHALRPVPDPSVLERLGLAPGGYVLALANRQPHKNIRVLFEAWRDPSLAGLQLVLVGPHGREAFTAHGQSPPAAAVFAGEVSDEAFRALYQAALCFAAPSLLEGFGLPAVEAMTLGCPVIISPRAGLLEVCGDAALHADPSAPAVWAEAIITCQAPAKQAELKARGLARAARFSWRAAAERLLQIVEQAAPVTLGA